MRIGHPDAPPLALTPFRELSSWASVLQAYEEWALSDGSSTRRSLAGELMRTVPRDVDRDPPPPSPLFATLCELPGKELQLVEELRGRPGIDSAQEIDLMEEFWAVTWPAALELPFRGVQSPFPNLRGMTDYFARELAAEGR